MKTTGFCYRVEAKVSFSPAEIDHLLRLSAAHRNSRCRAAGQVGGFLYGLNNIIKMVDYTEDTLEHTLKWSEVDTLRKITEMEGPVPGEIHLWFEFRKLLEKMSKESERVNK
jgi:hypothetical protein